MCPVFIIVWHTYILETAQVDWAKTFYPRPPTPCELHLVWEVAIGVFVLGFSCTLVHTRGVKPAIGTVAHGFFSSFRFPTLQEWLPPKYECLSHACFVSHVIQSVDSILSILALIVVVSSKCVLESHNKKSWCDFIFMHASLESCVSVFIIVLTHLWNCVSSVHHCLTHLYPWVSSSWLSQNLFIPAHPLLVNCTWFGKWLLGFLF